MEVLSVEALTSRARVKVLEAVDTQNLVVRKPVVPLQVEHPLAPDLEKPLHPDDCRRVMVVHAQVVQHRDYFLALDRRLNGCVADVKGMFAKPID